MNYHFIENRFTGKISTPCPWGYTQFKEGAEESVTRVGSLSCQECPGFVSVNENNNNVECIQGGKFEY